MMSPVGYTSFTGSAPDEVWGEVTQLFVAAFTAEPYNEDAIDLATIRQWGPEHLGHRGGRLVIATVDGRVVGFVLAHGLDADPAWLGILAQLADSSSTASAALARPADAVVVHELAVAEDQRGRGIARGCLAAVLQDRSETQTVIGVYERATEAAAMYHRWGLSELGRVPMPGDAIALRVLTAPTTELVSRLRPTNPESARMIRRTLWLSPWEWDCCGGPLETGQRATFSVWPVDDGQRTWLTEAIGADLTARIDGVEMHHEEDAAPERLTGRLAKLSKVSIPSRRIHTKRPPLPPGVSSAPARFFGSPDSAWFAEMRPSAYVTHHETVPGPPVVEETPRIPLTRGIDHPDAQAGAQAAAAAARAAAQAAQAAARAAQTTGPPPPGEVEPRLVGYLVELDVDVPDTEVGA
ncbi:GNAT family N-acetyltransferase [Plantibacter sp. CFBP 13570]|uniref:GNAT family N-acetyltransferase n=1 Tax=Plantibacter sp. CFBP 13570 TaxID=2775272 RepID=UPI001930AAFD|nr:GNAT family N-acetyltransferase [Plantibacter sp. CFBP 13570]MBD8534913.1 GNAT family N-acetyltransferase [Plantibacter sp. CFBP 13570]